MMFVLEYYHPHFPAYFIAKSETSIVKTGLISKSTKFETETAAIEMQQDLKQFHSKGMFKNLIINVKSINN